MRVNFSMPACLTITRGNFVVEQILFSTAHLCFTYLQDYKHYDDDEKHWSMLFENREFNKEETRVRYSWLFPNNDHVHVLVGEPVNYPFWK